MHCATRRLKTAAAVWTLWDLFLDLLMLPDVVLTTGG
ncbi:hypothetical protein SAURM35S_02954 [Streptomyces aurantiogriseus]